MIDVYCGMIQVCNEHYDTITQNQADIKVFKVKPSTYYHCITFLKTYLDDSELNRAKRYHFEKDRNRFIICRVLLKFVLARHTRQDIANIQIDTNSNKKPYLISDKTIHFNLSHTEDLALIALYDSAIGIDLEIKNSDYKFQDVLTHVYSNAEIKYILNSENQINTFYKFWTRKEAIVKATGIGINEHLLQIPAMDGHHKVESNIIGGVKNLNVLSFDVEDAHVASIAVEKEGYNMKTLCIYNLPDSIEELRTF